MRLTLAASALVSLLLSACAALPGRSGGDAEPPRRPVTQQQRPIPSPITDRFALRGIFYLPTIDTQVRVDSQAGATGTDVVAEEDLGLDDQPSQGRMELLFRLTERNRLRVDYFKTDRRAHQALERTINFGDETFNTGEPVDSELDWRMLGFTYSRSILRRERVEIGAGLGIYLLEASAAAEVTPRFAREEVEGVGAFPTPILDFTWRISRRFSFTARGQYMSASVDEFEGSLGDYHADVQYRWKPNFSVGLGYSVIRAALDVADEDFPGRFALDVSGPELFFRASF